VSFSERHGHKEVGKALQRESMDQALRNRLWNVVDQYVCAAMRSSFTRDPVYGTVVSVAGAGGQLFRAIWDGHLKLPLDKIGHPNRAMSHIREFFYSRRWFEVYDFLEYVLLPLAFLYPNSVKGFVTQCNNALDAERSAWRFVGACIAPLTTDEEIKAVETAMQDAAPIGSVQTQVERALQLLRQRPEADYRNSVKESIGAVESLACMVANRQKATLGEALVAIERSGSVRMHGALKAAFSKLYGYASDVARHKINVLEEGEVGQAEAQFMLVACSAFVSYLVAKAAEANIDLTAGQSGRAAGP